MLPWMIILLLSSEAVIATPGSGGSASLPSALSLTVVRRCLDRSRDADGIAHGMSSSESVSIRGSKGGPAERGAQPLQVGPVLSTARQALRLWIVSL